MYSFVIELAKDVNRAGEEDITITMLGFVSEIVKVFIADPDPNKISVTINKNFLFFRKNFYPSSL